MKRGLSITFIMGLLLGGMAGLIFWYWQKSTSAEDGALNLLDRLAEADRRLRQLTAELAGQVQTGSLPAIKIPTTVTDEVPSFLSRSADAGQSPPEVVEDLTEVKGIGPVFADRLQAAGITNRRQLTAVSAAALAQILDSSESRAQQILAAAKS